MQAPIRRMALLTMLVLAICDGNSSVADTGGGVFREDQYQALIADQHATRIGDIVTVLIYEDATATTSTDTGASKRTSVGVNALTSSKPLINGDVGVSNDFDGGAKTSRAGKLVARVSVIVQSVLANGDLMIHGSQVIEFNNEKQTIDISGRIRPIDIGSDNTILSTKIAEAVLKYKGEGFLSNREKPGIVTRFFNWLF
ncbi:MAG: flagellar basal body L-ring protein FlgH [Gammaproteobacteria bacterium]|nr:flagellar basal body L-ring protein FlgH [Gammaproteobacteria bacterium]MDH5728913.1 flagellar basal body L-ring protein FlgH [Gammaproteobacteria bacterium]